MNDLSYYPINFHYKRNCIKNIRLLLNVMFVVLFDLMHLKHETHINSRFYNLLKTNKKDDKIMQR